MNKLLLSIALVLISASVNATEIRVRSPQGNGDAAYEYFIKILELSLQDDPNSKVIKTNLTLSQKRVARLLENNRLLDIGWMGTNKDRESRLLAIKVPLYKGLLGKRIFAIRKDRLKDFQNITNQSQLQKLKACQGEHWPDSNILEFNSYKVVRIIRFQSMYKMLKEGRCDYFPRSVMEAYTELKTLNDNDIMLYTNIILSYPFPMYFFVNKNNKALHSKILIGLKKAIKSGEFLKLMKRSDFGKDVFPISKYRKSKIFHLKNPSLPHVNNQDKSHWLQLNK